MGRTAVSSWVFRLLGLATLAAIAGTGGVAPARACSCAGPPAPPVALEQSDAVFLGLAVAIEPLLLDKPPTWGSREFPADWWNDTEKPLFPSLYYDLRVTFVVDAAWKSVAGEIVTVITGADAASCGIGFKLGTRYLVYTHGIEATGEHRVNSCSRTSELFEAREDLKELPPPAVDYAAPRHRRDVGATEVLVSEHFDPSRWLGVAWCQYDSAGEPGAAGTEAAGGERSGLP